MLTLFSYQLNFIEVMIFILFLSITGFVLFLELFTALCADKEEINKCKKIALVFSVVQVVLLVVWIFWE